MVRTHENGFILVDLGSNACRLHVWPDGPLNKQLTHNPVHDHRFGYESVVLTGILAHVTYTPVVVAPGQGTHRIYEVNQYGKLLATSTEVMLDNRCELHVHRGQRYKFQPGLFHESIPLVLPTATLMFKTKEIEHVPRVLCLVGEPPDNFFNRDCANPSDVLWNYVVQTLLLVATEKL